MTCFLNLKGILIKSRGHKSAPELKQQSKTDNSGCPVIPKSSAASSPRSLPDLNGEKAPNLRVFAFSDLRNATDNFSRFFKIGEGGFGCVYKGMIKALDGQGARIVVAIKKLNKDGFQGHKQWLAEVRLLGVVEHPNLVKLIGYCAVDGERGMQRLLIYEYVPNRSLEDHLFHQVCPALSWQKRLEILLGAALGLAYLHEEVQVIYRDFKASNVLLDNDFKPKLSDFGLAREGPEAGQTHVSTAVVGTHGYAAPDYIKTGHLTTKSDVWSFGVVLYEVLTGRRSLERDRPKKDRKLLDWVKRFPAESRKFCTIMDPRLDGQYSVIAAQKLAQLADICLLKSAKHRPIMSEVVNRLKQIMESSGEESDPEKTLESSEIDTESSDTISSPMDASIATQRRMAHLAKLSDHVGGFSRRGAMIMQRAKVI